MKSLRPVKRFNVRAAATGKRSVADSGQSCRRPMPTSTITAGVVDRESWRPAEGRRPDRSNNLQKTATGVPRGQCKIFYPWISPSPGHFPSCQFQCNYNDNSCNMSNINTQPSRYYNCRRGRCLGDCPGEELVQGGMSRGEMSEFPRGKLGHSNPHCIVRFFSNCVYVHKDHLVSLKSPSTQQRWAMSDRHWEKQKKEKRQLQAYRVTISYVPRFLPEDGTI